MPSYDIRYLTDDGHLAHQFVADCDDEGRARILAHAMKLPSCKRLEIWRGTALVYARPPHTQPHMAPHSASRPPLRQAS